MNTLELERLASEYVSNPDNNIFDMERNVARAAFKDGHNVLRDELAGVLPQAESELLAAQKTAGRTFPALEQLISKLKSK